MRLLYDPANLAGWGKSVKEKKKATAKVLGLATKQKLARKDTLALSTDSSLWLTEVKVSLTTKENVEAKG